MIRRPPRSTQSRSSAASDVYKRQVRCFEDDEITHVDGDIDPIRDIETISTELILADLQVAEKRGDRLVRAARGDKSIEFDRDTNQKLVDALDQGTPAR